MRPLADHESGELAVLQANFEPRGIVASRSLHGEIPSSEEGLGGDGIGGGEVVECGGAGGWEKQKREKGDSYRKYLRNSGHADSVESKT